MLTYIRLKITNRKFSVILSIDTLVALASANFFRNLKAFYVNTTDILETISESRLSSIQRCYGLNVIP